MRLQKPLLSSSHHLAGMILIPLILMLLMSTARAELPVLLWGVQRSCERMASVDRLVEKELYSQNRRTSLLMSPSGKPLPACFGRQCGQVVRGACPSTTGFLIGGQLVQGRTVLKTRLWLYNLETGQLAIQDEYCENCVLTAALPAHARTLIEHPQFGSTPDLQPTYCSQGATPSFQPSSGPVFLTVYGEGKHKQAIHAALRAQLEASGRSVMPVNTETTHFSKEQLQSIVTGQQNARVLMAEMRGEGKVGVFLYDQNTEINDGKVVSCTDCDREQLITKIKETVSTFMDRCFGMSCAGTPSALRPAEACEPFPAEECPDSELLLPAVSSGAGEQDHITPRTGRLLKGIGWGLFAASAGTAIALAIANPYVVRKDADGVDSTLTLAGPAWGVAGAAAGILALDIPMTLLINRAQRGTAKPVQATTSSLVQCPNSN